jgi:23S rRNA (cytidine1920-2'-O)/16S rRNA (cytidine1409-2'-O)-methyltransferase
VTRVRLDVALVDRGLAASRERARAAVLAGDVTVDGQVVTKAGHQVADDAEIAVAPRPEFVSRGGLKLAEALRGSGLDPSGLRAIDVGASTGGFTDCLLQRGATSVAAVDVGYGQLAWSLRTDPRVAVFERTNIRHAEPGQLGAPFDLAVVDVSFIGLAKVLPAIGGMLTEEGSILALVKPQFEAGKGRVGKRGVVREPEVHVDVLREVCASARGLGWVVRGMGASPVKGPEGNIEFWLWLARTGEAAGTTPEDIVDRAHEALG